MKNFLWITISMLLFSFSCEDQNLKIVELEDLESLEDQIIQLSESVACTQSSEWKITPMGNKACGGPARYIAYHVSVEEDFLKLVNQYTQEQKNYTEKTGAISDCSLVLPPTRITCEGGKAVLVY